MSEGPQRQAGQDGPPNWDYAPDADIPHSDGCGAHPAGPQPGKRGVAEADISGDPPK